ncbi:MAG: polymer-forming cytoskeletal protein [Leptolinea sp.]
MTKRFGFMELLSNNRRMLVSGTLLFCLLFVWVTPAHAQGVVYGNGIPAGSVVDQDVILSGTEIAIDGIVNGDVLALGQIVTVNGTINGSLYSGAEILTVGGKVNGSVYSAGGTLRLRPEAKLERSAFFAGGLLDLQSGSMVTRDLYSLALGAQFNGTIIRDTRAIIGPSELFKAFLSVTGLQMPVITLPVISPVQNPTPTSSLMLASLLPLPGMQFSWEPANHYAAVSLPADTPPTDTTPFDWLKWGKAILQTIAELLLLGILLAWFKPNILRDASKSGWQHPWIALFYGLGVLVISFSALVLAFIVLMVLGSFFNWASLYVIAWIIWVGGSAAILLAAALFVVIFVFLSKLVVAYCIGNWLVEKMTAAANIMHVLLVTIGVIIYALLASIPSLGWIVSLTVTLYGLGACWLWLRSRIDGLQSISAETL